MGKGNTKKAKESLVRQPAAKQSSDAANISETAIVPPKALNSSGPAKRPPKTPERSVPAQGSLAAAAPQCPKPAAQTETSRWLEQAVVVAEAPSFSDVAKVMVTFVFPICECCAKSVFLSGDFNGWSPSATPMKRYDDGHWEKDLELAPGRYEYKFVRDGEWMPDLLARENVLNTHGTLNSVIEVRV